MPFLRDDSKINGTNTIGNQSKVLLFIDLKELGKDVIHFGKRKQGIENLCVSVNVWRNKPNETYLTASELTGNHWTCSIVEFLSRGIFYCDSLAWLAPPNLLLKLKPLTSLIKVNLPNIQDFEIYTVNKDTEINAFLYQGPNQNVCGIACLFRAIFITDSDIRHELRLRNQIPERLVTLLAIDLLNEILRT